MRLFVAIDLPDDASDRLATLQAGVPGVKWVPDENLHLTLRFIGEVEGATAEELAEALAEVRAPAFELSLSGVDVFERGRQPHTLWVGVDRNPALQHLREKVESALVRAGLESERRRFSPHVTLGRMKQRPGHHLVQWLEANALFRAEPFTVGGFTLFTSHLGSESARYFGEAFYPLEGAPAYF
ncbi:MAG: RNA 2',3'-cyclic phosphodiesterase, partial [bacterium]|nr:RNA 2',3'-cyclic phosphodiesterase [bacterium]